MNTCTSIAVNLASCYYVEELKIAF